jgi:hypothetical protein
MPIAVGDTFLMTTGSPTGSNANHLLVAITHIAIDAGGMLLFVPVSSVKPARSYDKTCEIAPVDAAHPFITKDSFIDYSVPVLRTPAAILNQAIPGPDGNPTRQSLPEDLIKRIRQGVYDSGRVKRFARDHLQRCEQLEKQRTL